jgi:hypothetical protein
MTISAIREKLQDYIKTADDKKIEAIFTLVESDIEKEYHWWEDEEFLDELDERGRRHKEGIDRAYTFEEAKEEILKLKSEKSG